MRLFFIVIAFFSQVNVAIAADTYGEIRATLNGEDRVWYILGSEGSSNSDWTQLVRTMFDVSLWGSAEEADPYYVPGALLIDFSALGSEDDWDASEIEVQYLENGYVSMYLANDDEDSAVTIDDLRVEDGTMFLSGSFYSNVYYRANAMSLETDRSKSIVIKGTFRVELPEQE
ncbi:hypothetical protein [Defluviimonas sp. WL0075]|uniref:Uncharacterized protein n=1 Tax=Albidovulum sediminicola TaxID=2984331 RepID=A0ABT2Z1Y0_9RHOB|nr:hypothetical protein [Defluviimonas sp. WL0075]MCV2865144.1 hypothetical protein [Defluviimonas sp. WL0075]